MFVHIDPVECQVGLITAGSGNFSILGDTAIVQLNAENGGGFGNRGHHGRRGMGPGPDRGDFDPTAEVPQGLLDRLDSLLFAFPLTYLYAAWVFA